LEQKKKKRKWKWKEIIECKFDIVFVFKKSGNLSKKIIYSIMVEKNEKSEKKKVYHC